MISRNTAYKLWISNINSSNYTKSPGEFESNYIEFKNKKISRVNIIAAVVDKYEKDNYSSILVDDGSSQISIKSWNDDKKIIDKVNVGDVILLIGKIKKNSMNPSLYIQPEIIKKIDDKWLLARKNEMEREYGTPEMVNVEYDKETEELTVEEVKVSNESIRTQVLNLIDKLDKDDGVPSSIITKQIKSPKVNGAIEELLK